MVLREQEVTVRDAEWTGSRHLDHEAELDNQEEPRHQPAPDAATETKGDSDAGADMKGMAMGSLITFFTQR